jgi:hypothetical protein
MVSSRDDSFVCFSVFASTWFPSKAICYHSGPLWKRTATATQDEPKRSYRTCRGGFKHTRRCAFLSFSRPSSSSRRADRVTPSQSTIYKQLSNAIQHTVLNAQDESRKFYTFLLESLSYCTLEASFNQEDYCLYVSHSISALPSRSLLNTS